MGRGGGGNGTLVYLGEPAKNREFHGAGAGFWGRGGLRVPSSDTNKAAAALVFMDTVFIKAAAAVLVCMDAVSVTAGSMIINVQVTVAAF